MPRHRNVALRRPRSWEEIDRKTNLTKHNKLTLVLFKFFPKLKNRSKLQAGMFKRLLHTWHGLVYRYGYNEHSAASNLEHYIRDIQNGNYISIGYNHNNGREIVAVWNQYKGYVCFLIEEDDQFGTLPITVFHWGWELRDDADTTYLDLLLAAPKAKGKGSKRKNQWIKERVKDEEFAKELSI